VSWLYDFGLLSLIQLVASSAMFGIIWLVQLVLYPAFASIDESRWFGFHKLHTDNITWLVGPLMCVELAVSLATFLMRPSAWSGVGLALTLSLWAMTFFRSVPLHMRLSRSRDSAERTVLVEALLRHNLWRSLLWTARLIVAVVLARG